VASKPLLFEFKKTKSQLQTVLITASGPQAFNALVHRERYTQGSRQNRCVSSQDALALRAKVNGTGETRDRCVVAASLLVCAASVVYSTSCDQGTVGGDLPEVGLNLSPISTRDSSRGFTKNCQLRTAYGGESNCIIKT
jgi:hypothetical protein